MNCDVAQIQTLVMNSGGLRSMVATAMAIQDVGVEAVGLLHISDGRSNATRRKVAFEKQAEHYKIGQRHVLPMPHLFGLEQGRFDEWPLIGVVRPQLLFAAGQVARTLRAKTLIWPLSCDGDDRLIALASEQMIICEHLAQIEGMIAPGVDAPLLELTDVQLVEIAAQLDAPLAMAFSCETKDETPCGNCPACRRRQSAFDAAHVLHAA